MTQARVHVGDLSGPELYGVFLVYQVAGRIPPDAGKDLAVVLRNLAKEPAVLAWFLEHYPESRFVEYRAVAKMLCAALCEEAALMDR